MNCSHGQECGTLSIFVSIHFFTAIKRKKGKKRKGKQQTRFKRNVVQLTVSILGLIYLFKKYGRR
jgi:hypothetical protein